MRRLQATNKRRLRADAFDIADDDVNVGRLRHPLHHFAQLDVGLVAGGHHLIDREAALQRQLVDMRAIAAALADQPDTRLAFRQLALHVAEKGHIGLAAQAEAADHVGAEQADAVLPGDPRDFLLLAPPFFPEFGEAAGEQHHGPDTLVGALAQRLDHQRGGQRDDRAVDAVRGFAQAGIGRQAHPFQGDKN
ncbi:hypothetical protein D3C72_906170 [compost metagenome]